MKKYLEQVTWQLNPIAPDRRKSGRWLQQDFPVGTRWSYDEETGELFGEGMSLRGPHAEEIRSHCKEVEASYGVLISQFEAMKLIGQLIDVGRITTTDIRDCIEREDSDDDAFDENDDDETFSKKRRRNNLKRQQFNYRHWLSLDPPDESLEQQVAEDEHKDAILREYEERTKRRE